MMTQRRGMTLVEAVLALSLTVVIGLIATTVTVAMLDIRRSTDGYTENVQAARVSLAQLQKIIRTSRVVIAGDPTSMTLWAFDDDDPGVMNAEEIVRLNYSPGDDAVLMWYMDLKDVPDVMRNALNIQLTLDECRDWNHALNLVNLGVLEVREVATDLSSIRFHYDLAPPYTTVVAIDASFGTDGGADSNDGRAAACVHTAAALRIPKTSAEALADAGYSGGTP